MSTATSDTYRTYKNSNCTGTFTTSTESSGTCSTWTNAKNVGYKQTCTALFPTAAPSTRPTGPSYEPTPMPVSASPTNFPNAPGAIYTGYMVKPQYGDSQCSLQSMTQAPFQQLGVCLKDWDNPSSQSYITYYVPTPRDWVAGYFVVNHYSDAVCGIFSYADRNYVSGCELGNINHYYSATVPVFTDGVYQV